MPSDQLVSARHVLQAAMELQRRRSRRVLSELEKLEPDLAEYVLENLTQLHHELVRHGLSGREARRVYRLAESTVLVSLVALRRAYRSLLGEDATMLENGQPPFPGGDSPPA